MEFRVLGPLEIRKGERRIELRRKKQRALLSVLVLNAGHAVSVDRLVESLWGETPPPRAIGSLQNLVSELRKELGPDVLVTRAPGYALDVARDSVDVHRFVRLLEQARSAADPAARVVLLREALSLWRGDALADVAFEPFAAAEAERLEELRVQAREEVVEAGLRLGRHRDVLQDAETLVKEQPFRERPRALLMLALYRSGRQAAALEAYQEARRFLRSELALEPGPALQKLQHAILRQDPALDAPASALVPVGGEERLKTVTVAFADIVDSTALSAALDPEAYRDVLRRWYRAARSVFESHGGAVEKFIGDAVVAVFGVPVQHEDDALRAVRAAVDLDRAVEALNADLEPKYGVTLRWRAGINTGEAVAGDADTAVSFATGYAVNVAAKLQQTAADNAIVVGSTTYSLIRDAVTARPIQPLELGPRTVAAFRIVSLAPRKTGIPRSFDTPLVGRERELATLRLAFDDVRDTRASRVVTVAGEPGIGKSRLAAELAASLDGEARVAVGRCVAYGEGATYLPVAEIVRALAPDGSEDAIAAIAGDDAEARLVARRLRALFGWSDDAIAAGEGTWAVRRLLEGVARKHATLLVLDDIHWAEQGLLDLVDQLRERALDARLLVVCLARDEIRETRPDWPVDVGLDALEDADAAELVAGLPGAAVLPEALRKRIAAAAAGNALFAEQLVAYAVEGGLDAPDGVPPSLDALLSSRLDRLPETERGVLERAAVVGREFWRGAVAALSERDVDAELASLSAKRFVRAGPSTLPDEEALRFHHVLIRDVAYAAITKERRANLHDRIAKWLDEREPVADELVGYHLEQAYILGRTVGRDDTTVARAAAERLGAAGMRSLKHADAAAATALLGRATSLLRPDDETRIELLIELAIALRPLGRAEDSASTLREAIAHARAAGDDRLRLRAEIEALNLEANTDPEGRATDLIELARRAIPVFEAAGDHRALGRAWILIGDAEGATYGRSRAWAEAATRARHHYEQAGFPPVTPIAKLAAALCHGPEPVPSAVEQCEQLLRDAAGHPYAEASVRAMLGALVAQRRQFAEARALIEAAAEGYRAIHQQTLVASVCDELLGGVEMLAGDYEAAERAFRAGSEFVSESANRSTALARLAHALFAQGRVDEAGATAREAAATAPPDDALARSSSRAGAAKVLASRGSFAEAERLAREAVALLAETDWLNEQATVYVDLAVVLRAAGRVEQAAGASATALALYRQKGNVAAAHAVRRLAQEFTPVW